jgi:hypothetical protein
MLRLCNIGGFCPRSSCRANLSVYCVDVCFAPKFEASKGLNPFAMRGRDCGADQMSRRIFFAEARVILAPLSFSLSPGDCPKTKIAVFAAKSSRSEIIEFQDGQK